MLAICNSKLLVETSWRLVDVLGAVCATLITSQQTGHPRVHRDMPRSVYECTDRHNFGVDISIFLSQLSRCNEAMFLRVRSDCE